MSERLDAIRERWQASKSSAAHDQQLIGKDVPWLLAELAAARKERDEWIRREQEIRDGSLADAWRALAFKERAELAAAREFGNEANREAIRLHNQLVAAREDSLGWKNLCEGAEAQVAKLQERLRANHDDVRKACERAEQAYRERDAAREQTERYEKALTAIAEGGLGDEPWFASYDRIRDYARAVLAVSKK